MAYSMPSLPIELLPWRTETAQKIRIRMASVGKPPNGNPEDPYYRDG